MRKILDGIINNMSATNTENTYEKDGLFYCKTCDTPRQTVIEHPLTGEPKTVGVMCKCQSEKRDAEEQERKDADRRMKMKRARLNSFENSDYTSMTFSTDDGKTPELSKQMRNYARHFQTFKEQGQGLILFGEVGTGKTFYSACIANALIDEGYSVLMTSFPTLIARMQRNAFKEDTVAFVAKHDLLIVDDLGVERSTEYMQENVYNIINARYKSKKPIIVSTNLSIQEMKNPSDIMGERIYGRLLERCAPIQFKGVDRRRTKSRYGDMFSILNGNENF